MNQNYGKLKKITVSRGKLHEYLVITLDFILKGEVKVRMDNYVEENMMRNFPHKLNSTDMAIMPAGNNLFNNVNGKPLGKSQAQYFHPMVV